MMENLLYYYPPVCLAIFVVTTFADWLDGTDITVWQLIQNLFIAVFPVVNIVYFLVTIAGLFNRTRLGDIVIVPGRRK